MFCYHMCRHVVLGFSECGNYLISYCCQISLAPPTTFYHYSLHWWHFDLYKRLHLVSSENPFPYAQSMKFTLSFKVGSYDLFRDEVINRELHLIVCQSIGQQDVVVLGCRYAAVLSVFSPGFLYGGVHCTVEVITILQEWCYHSITINKGGTFSALWAIHCHYRLVQFPP